METVLRAYAYRGPRAVAVVEHRMDAKAGDATWPRRAAMFAVENGKEYVVCKVHGRGGCSGQGALVQNHDAHRRLGTLCRTSKAEQTWNLVLTSRQNTLGPRCGRKHLGANGRGAARAATLTTTFKRLK